ncbi:unnamed protein product, partial [Amoebophrya sp. A25]
RNELGVRSREHLHFRSERSLQQSSSGSASRQELAAATASQGSLLGTGDKEVLASTTVASSSQSTKLEEGSTSSVHRGGAQQHSKNITMRRGASGVHRKKIPPHLVRPTSSRFVSPDNEHTASAPAFYTPEDHVYDGAKNRRSTCSSSMSEQKLPLVGRFLDQQLQEKANPVVTQVPTKYQTSAIDDNLMIHPLLTQRQESRSSKTMSVWQGPAVDASEGVAAQENSFSMMPTPVEGEQETLLSSTFVLSPSVAAGRSRGGTSDRVGRPTSTDRPEEPTAASPVAVADNRPRKPENRIEESMLSPFEQAADGSRIVCDGSADPTKASAISNTDLSCETEDDRRIKMLSSLISLESSASGTALEVVAASSSAFASPDAAAEDFADIPTSTEVEKEANSAAPDTGSAMQPAASRSLPSGEIMLPSGASALCDTVLDEMRQLLGADNTAGRSLSLSELQVCDGEIQPVARDGALGAVSRTSSEKLDEIMRSCQSALDEAEATTMAKEGIAQEAEVPASAGGVVDDRTNSVVSEGEAETSKSIIEDVVQEICVNSIAMGAWLRRIPIEPEDASAPAVTAARTGVLCKPSKTERGMQKSPIAQEGSQSSITTVHGSPQVGASVPLGEQRSISSSGKFDGSLHVLNQSGSSLRSDPMKQSASLVRRVSRAETLASAVLEDFERMRSAGILQTRKKQKQQGSNMVPGKPQTPGMAQASSGKSVASRTTAVPKYAFRAGGPRAGGSTAVRETAASRARKQYNRNEAAAHTVSTSTNASFGTVHGQHVSSAPAWPVGGSGTTAADWAGGASQRFAIKGATAGIIAGPARKFSGSSTTHGGSVSSRGGTGTVSSRGDTRASPTAVAEAMAARKKAVDKRRLEALARPRPKSRGATAYTHENVNAKTGRYAPGGPFRSAEHSARTARILQRRAAALSPRAPEQIAELATEGRQAGVPGGRVASGTRSPKTNVSGLKPRVMAARSGERVRSGTLSSDCSSFAAQRACAPRVDANYRIPIPPAEHLPLPEHLPASQPWGGKSDGGKQRAGKFHFAASPEDDTVDTLREGGAPGSATVTTAGGSPEDIYNSVVEHPLNFTPATTAHMPNPSAPSTRTIDPKSSPSSTKISSLNSVDNSGGIRSYPSDGPCVGPEASSLCNVSSIVGVSASDLLVPPMSRLSAVTPRATLSGSVKRAPSPPMLQLGLVGGIQSPQ